MIGQSAGDLISGGRKHDACCVCMCLHMVPCGRRIAWWMLGLSWEIRAAFYGIFGHQPIPCHTYTQRTLRIRFELFSFVTVFLGLMAVSCAVALLVVLLVEKPFMKLQKLYFETPKGPTAAERRRAAQLAARNKGLPTNPPTKTNVELVAPAKGSAEALCTCGVE